MYCTLLRGTYGLPAVASLNRLSNALNRPRPLAKGPGATTSAPPLCFQPTCSLSLPSQIHKSRYYSFLLNKSPSSALLQSLNISARKLT